MVSQIHCVHAFAAVGEGSLFVQLGYVHTYIYMCTPHHYHMHTVCCLAYTCVRALLLIALCCHRLRASTMHVCTDFQF